MDHHRSWQCHKGLKSSAYHWRMPLKWKWDQNLAAVTHYLGHSHRVDLAHFPLSNVSFHMSFNLSVSAVIKHFLTPNILRQKKSINLYWSVYFYSIWSSLACPVSHCISVFGHLLLILWAFRFYNLKRRINRNGWVSAIQTEPFQEEWCSATCPYLRPSLNITLFQFK